MNSLSPILDHEIVAKVCREQNDQRTCLAKKNCQEKLSHPPDANEPLKPCRQRTRINSGVQTTPRDAIALGKKRVTPVEAKIQPPQPAREEKREFIFFPKKINP